MFYLRFQKILDYMFFNIKGYQRVTFSSFSFLSFYSIFLQSLLILCPPFHMISSNNSISITQFLTIVYLVFSCHNNKVVFFRHLFKRFHNTNLTALSLYLNQTELHWSSVCSLTWWAGLSTHPCPQAVLGWVRYSAYAYVLAHMNVLTLQLHNINCYCCILLCWLINISYWYVSYHVIFSWLNPLYGKKWIHFSSSHNCNDHKINLTLWYMSH